MSVTVTGVDNLAEGLTLSVLLHQRLHNYMLIMNEGKLDVDESLEGIRIDSSHCSFVLWLLHNKIRMGSFVLRNFVTGWL